MSKSAVSGVGGNRRSPDNTQSQGATYKCALAIRSGGNVRKREVFSTFPPQDQTIKAAATRAACLPRTGARWQMTPAPDAAKVLPYWIMATLNSRVTERSILSYNSSQKERFSMGFTCKNDGRCLICSYYGKCSFGLKRKFEETELFKYADTLWGRCATKNNTEYCTTCPNYKACRLERGLEYREYAMKNVVINVYPDSNKIEVLRYKKPFRHLVEAENLDPVDRQRLLEKNVKGEYEPVSDDFTIQALQRSIRSASKRSKDNFYGYAQANDWEYFVTLTFSPEVVDRSDDAAVIHLWSEFQRWCKRKSPDCKMLMIPERHEKGEIHFHGLMSDIALTLTPATNAKTGEPLYSRTGFPLFNIKDWTNGFSTLAIIPKEDNYRRVVNYMEKYISKDGNIGYNQKRFFRTRNLLFKNKSILLYDDCEFEDFIKSLGLEEVKDSDRMTVYRKKETSSE